MTVRAGRRIVVATGAVLLLGVLGFAIWVLVWATHYAPLTQGNLGAGPYGAGRLVEPAPVSGGEPVFFARYRPGGTFRVGFSVTNGGSQPISLVGSPLSIRAGSPIFRVVRVEVGPHDLNEGHGGVSGGDYPRQFVTVDSSHPASLRAGDQRMLFVTYRIVAHCFGKPPSRPQSGGMVTGFNTIPLRFRLWDLFTRTQWFKLPDALALTCTRGIDPSPDAGRLPTG